MNLILFFTRKIIIFSLTIICLISFSLPVSAKKNHIPHKVTIVLLKMRGYMETGEILKAIKVIENFQARQPMGMKPGDPDPKGYQHHFINFNLGNCYLKLNKPLKAAQYYKAAVHVKPDFYPAWLNLAKCYYDLERYTDAGNSFLKAFKVSEKKDPGILYYAAASFMADEKTAQALKVVNRLVSEYNDGITLQWKKLIAQLYIICNKHFLALPYLKELSENLTGKEKKYWQELLFHEYITLNMKKEAFVHAKRLVQEDPIDPKWWKILSQIYFYNDKYEDGLAPLTICTYLKPASFQEKKFMGDLCLSLGIPIKSIDYYKDSIKEKKTIHLYERLAHAYLALYEPEKALNVLEKGLKHFPEKKLYVLKGQILLENEKYEEAMVLYEKMAKEKITPHGKAWLMAGYAAFNSDNILKAKYNFTKASKYNKQKKRAIKALLQVNRHLEIRKIKTEKPKQGVKHD